MTDRTDPGSVMRWRLEDSYGYEYVDGGDQILPPVPPDGWPIPDVGEVIKFGGREATVVQIVWYYDIPKMIVRLKNTTEQARSKVVCAHHAPVQHRDGKPPWCHACGLTASYQEPGSLSERANKDLP